MIPTSDGPDGSVSPPVVALYLKDLRAGGAQRVFLNLCHGLLNAGFAVDMVLARGEGALLKQLPDGTRLVDLQSRGALAAIAPLRRYLKKRRPAAFLSSINYVNVTALLATWFLSRRFPVVVREANVLNAETFRSGNLHDRILLGLMRLLYPRADRVIVNSQDTRASLLAFRVVRADKIISVPNPVDMNRIRLLAAEPSGHPWLDRSADDTSNSPVVLGAGSFSRQKNFSLLIRAFHGAVNSAAPDSDARRARLIIIGDGEDRVDLESLVRQLDLESRVSLPGYADNPFAYMARVDLFVLSSLWEGSANVLVEALACGSPVIATDCPGGAREILFPDGSQNGYGTIIRSDDIEELTSAIRAMLERSSANTAAERTRKIKHAARFDVPLITDRYREVLGLRAD